MLRATQVKSTEELIQVNRLNQENLRHNLSPAEQQFQGFVTWLYPLTLLEKMHNLMPSILVKDDGRIVGYALSTPKEAAAFHPDLQSMVNNLEKIEFEGKPLTSRNYYVMGQVCIDKPYRGKGVFQKLFQEHKALYQKEYELMVTEISTSNSRSQRAHEKMGFRTCHTYRDSMDEWNVVVWNWEAL